MRTIVLTLLLGAALFRPAAAKADDRLATIHLPEGFVIEAFAEVPNARQMAWPGKAVWFCLPRDSAQRIVNRIDEPIGAGGPTPSLPGNRIEITVRTRR